jgi:hypothetical protein
MTSKAQKARSRLRKEAYEVAEQYLSGQRNQLMLVYDYMVGFGPSGTQSGREIMDCMRYRRGI